MPEETFFPVFSPEILYHLGLSMYRNPYKAISELVMNSYDADATEVRITIDLEAATPYIAIDDNGVGMSWEEIRDCYLRLGYNSRDVFGDVTARRRKRIGTKGIGKLAGLGISERMRLETRKARRFSAMNLDIGQLMALGDLSKAPIPVETAATDLPEGTCIILNRLTEKGRRINPEKLRGYMARNFTPQDEFNVFVNGELCSTEEIAAESRVLDCRLRGLGSVTGTLYYLDAVPPEPGVKVKVLERTVLSPTLFGYTRQSHGYFTATRVYGEVNADFLDEAINTSRDGFDSENEKWVSFAQWIETQLKAFVKTIQSEKRRARTTQVPLLPGLKDKIDQLPPETRAVLENHIAKFLRACDDLDDDTTYELMTVVIQFFEGAALRELSRLIAQADVVETEHIAGLLKEYGFRRIINWVEAIRDWLAVLEKFQELISADTKHEIEVHRILVDNLWIIDESLELKGNNQQIKTILGKLSPAGQKVGFLEEFGRKRPDIVATSDGLITVSGVPTRQLKLVELKKPAVRVGYREIEQTKTYLTLLKRALGGDYDSYKAYLGCGQLDEGVDPEIEFSGTFEIVNYTQLLGRCERRYQFLLDKIQG